MSTLSWKERLFINKLKFPLTLSKGLTLKEEEEDEDEEAESEEKSEGWFCY